MPYHQSTVIKIKDLHRDTFFSSINSIWSFLFSQVLPLWLFWCWFRINFRSHITHCLVPAWDSWGTQCYRLSNYYWLLLPPLARDSHWETIPATKQPQRPSNYPSISSQGWLCCYYYFKDDLIYVCVCEYLCHWFFSTRELNTKNVSPMSQQAQ